MRVEASAGRLLRTRQVWSGGATGIVRLAYAFSFLEAK